MGRMENPNLEETTPSHLGADKNSNSDAGETRPLSIDPPTPDALDAGETLPIPIDASELESDAGTIPVSVQQSQEPSAAPEGSDAPAFAETMPVNVEPPLQPETADETAFAETMPVAVQTQPPQPPPVPPDAGAPTGGRRPISIRAVALLGLLGLALVALLSAYSGYQSGISQRKAAQAEANTQIVDEQFQLGMQDLQAHRYDLARQRFEYVINLDPNYPGVTDKLAEALMFINTTATPTVAPTPTLTPTPDMRGVEELFTQAQQDLANSEWDKAINTLLALRKADQNYQAVWVDDMLYVSFRNRGRDKILKNGDLEGGIYDLTLAEQFGPLDTDSKSYLTWARLYITGASFWELDWAQAVYYFGQVAPALPNLRDGSNWSATERYRQALAGYGGSLADGGDWCAAVEQYELSLSIGVDPQVEEAYAQAVEKCSGGGEEQQNEEETPPEVTDEPVTTVAPTEPPPPEATPTEAPPPEATPTEEAPPPEATPTP